MYDYNTIENETIKNDYDPYVCNTAQNHANAAKSFLKNIFSFI